MHEPEAKKRVLDFLSPLSVIPGMGPKRISVCKESDIHSVGDLLYYLPKRYVDRSCIVPLGEIAQHLDSTVTIRGTISRMRVERGRQSRFRILVDDGSGSLEVIWFQGASYLANALAIGQHLLLTGKISFYRHVQMTHPMLDKLSSAEVLPTIPFLPRYTITSSMREGRVGQKTLSTAIAWALNNVNHFPRIIPDPIEKTKQFPSLESCLRALHMPEKIDALEYFRARLRYEELYQLAITLRWSRRKFLLPGRTLVPKNFYQQLITLLPYTLSSDQQEAIACLHADAASEHRMHRLLQGDVGSGKTVVAFAATLPALATGLSVLWIAPTEILARQTCRVLEPWLKHLEISIKLVVGGLTAAAKRNLSKESSGTPGFFIGTHALCDPNFKPGPIGMIVVDEQHKFGVAQRLALQEKDPAADFLLLSATPIPQTLAQTIYGDLDIISLRHSVRKGERIATHLVPDAKRSNMESFILKEVTTGSQVFWVVPRVESQPDDDEPLASADSHGELLKKTVLGACQIATLHGKLTPLAKLTAMNDFSEGKADILVATTIIEVGIDVPRARIMIIENAERFGLSQLHQLRGRIGRDGNPAWCFLLSSMPQDSPSMERLKAFTKETDGFALADLDLHLRGPGDVVGNSQWGFGDLRLADILRDAALFREIQATIAELLPRG